MASFLSSRKTDFRAGRQALTYDGKGYWKNSELSFSTRLGDREIIIRDRIPAGSSVLVVGCGTSLLMSALIEKGCKVTASDIGPDVVEFLSKNGIHSFVLDLENITDASFPEKYDVVVASEVLEHIRNPEHAIEVLARHTKRFLISIPNSAFYRYRLHLMFAGRFFNQGKNDHPAEHLRYWSHTDFIDWLGAMDLHLQAAIPSNGLSCMGLCTFMKDVWPNLFGHQIVYDCEAD